VGIRQCARHAGIRPGGRDTFLLRGKKVPKETRPAAPALRAEGSPESRPFARRMAKQLAMRNPALTPRCGRSAGPVAKLAGHKTAVVGQRDRTAPGEPSSLGGAEGDKTTARVRQSTWRGRSKQRCTCPSSPYRQRRLSYHTPAGSKAAVPVIGDDHGMRFWRPVSEYPRRSNGWISVQMVGRFRPTGFRVDSLQRRAGMPAADDAAHIVPAAEGSLSPPAASFALRK
jgi:hypothetical protein